MEKLNTVFLYDFDEIEKIVHDNFDRSFDYLDIYEPANDSCYLYGNISPLLSKSDLMELEAMKGENGVYVPFDLVLKYLCKNGIIPSGNYLISVSW